MKKTFILIIALLVILFIFGSSCELIDFEPETSEKENDDTNNDITLENGPLKEPLDVEVRGAHTDDEIAFQFTWESSKDYPGQFHDLIQYDGDGWNDLKNNDKIAEDRVSIMIEDPEFEVDGFEEAGCYVTCHEDMAGHYVEAEDSEQAGEFGLDMWEWGGQKSSMEYAQDKWVSRGEPGSEYDGIENNIIEEETEKEITTWINKEGDKIIEQQPAQEVKWQGAVLPRFVFNPGEVIFDNYFYADEEGTLITDTEKLLESIGTMEDPMEYEPLKVVYQDYDFNPEDEKVNSVDTGFLIAMAKEEIDPGLGEDWEEYWSEKLGITTPEDAKEMLNDIVEQLEEGAMLTKDVGFIYESSQHNVTSTREFDQDSNTWTVTLVRDISTGEDEEDAAVEDEEDENDEEEEITDDVDFEDLLEEEVYNMAFAIHDINRGGLWHHVSLPFQVSAEETGVDLEMASVEEDLTIDTTDEIDRTDWNEIEPFEVTVYIPGKVYYQDLTDEGFHGEGARFLEDEARCQDCHSEEEISEMSEK